MHIYVGNWWNTMKYMKVARDWTIFTNFFDSNRCNIKRNNDLTEKCRLKRSKSLNYELTFSIVAQTTDKIQRNYVFAYVSIWFTFPICKPVNKCQSVSDRLWQIMQFHWRAAHFDRLSCAVDIRCSVIGWVADILCQIIDRNFMCCHWQFLQIGLM